MINLVVQGILDSLAASQRTEVKAWEAEIGTCDHVDQLVPSSTPSSELGKYRLKGSRLYHGRERT